MSKLNSKIQAAIPSTTIPSVSTAVSSNTTNASKHSWRTELAIKAGIIRVEKTYKGYLGINDAWVINLNTNKMVFDPDLAAACQRVNGGTQEDRWANAMLRREVRSALADLRRQQKAARASRREALATLKNEQKKARVLAREQKTLEKKADRLERNFGKVAWTWEEAEAQRKNWAQAQALRQVIAKKAAAVEAAETKARAAEDIFLGIDAEKKRVDVRVEETLYSAWALGVRGIKEAPPSTSRPAFVVSFVESTEAVA